MGWVAQILDYLGNVALVLEVDVVVDLDLCHRQEKMVSLLWQGLKSLFSWQLLGWGIYPNWLDPFCRVSWVLVSDIYEILLVSYCSKDGMVQPLSDQMYLGHMYTGRKWLMNVDTIVSADGGENMLAAWSGRFTFCYQICGNFAKWLLWYLCHFQRVRLNLGFFPVA